VHVPEAPTLTNRGWGIRKIENERQRAGETPPVRNRKADRPVQTSLRSLSVTGLIASVHTSLGSLSVTGLIAPVHTSLCSLSVTGLIAR
jgi:hypothetical protein